MARRLIVTAGWLAAAVLAVLVGLLAISVIGDGTHLAERPADEPGRGRARAGRRVTASPSASRFGGHRSEPDTVGDRRAAPFPTRAGTVVGRCAGSRAEIVSMSPAQGYSVHEHDTGLQDDDAEGEFRGITDDHDRVKVEHRSAPARRRAGPGRRRATRIEKGPWTWSSASTARARRRCGCTAPCARPSWTAGCRPGIGCRPPACWPPTWAWPATASPPRTSGWSPRAICRRGSARARSWRRCATRPAPRRAAADPLRPRAGWDFDPAAGQFGRPVRRAYDFRTGIPDAQLFPFDTWRRLVAAEVRLRANSPGTYAEPAGHPALRAAIARYLGVARSVRADRRRRRWSPTAPSRRST